MPRAELVAYELLRAGEWEEGIGVLKETLEELRREDGVLPSDLERSWQEILGILHLRRAIEEACLDGRSPDRCVVPMDSGAAYANPEPSRAAARAFRQLVAARPWKWVARWLLNVSHMTLGQYPDAVPERWLIPTSAFESEAGAERFRDVAPELDLDVAGLSGGVVLEDFDEDGDLDLMASARGLQEQLRYFRNEGDGTFTERTEAAGIVGLTGGLNLEQADYDADGDMDVLVLRGGWLPRGWPNSLLQNQGDGTFTDVTEEAGLLHYHPTQTAAWGDYDNDGDLDLYVGNETGRNPGSPRHPSRLHANDGSGTFTDVAPEAGVDVKGFVKGVAWGDYDNDGRLDLYVSRLGERNALFHNLGPDGEGVWHFEEVAEEAGVTGPRLSFPVWFFDYDNDGWQDLFVASLGMTVRNVVAEYMGAAESTVPPRLYRNRGDGTFADVTSEVGLDRTLYVMGSNFGDLDNDGYPDLFLGTGAPDMRALLPTRVFRNDGGDRFRDVTTAGGFGHLGKGSGVAFGDVDGDGDQDAYVVYGGAYQGDVFRNVLYENPGHGHHWLTLRLQGRTANRDGIGARIRVVVGTAGNGEREIHVTTGSGGSFGASSLQQEIGLGDATEIRRLEIRWPGSGGVDVYEEVEMDRTYRLREGAGRLEPVAAERFELGPADGASP